MELKDTVDLMTSEDYKGRFKAEYLNALEIRAEVEGIILDYVLDKH